MNIFQTLTSSNLNDVVSWLVPTMWPTPQRVSSTMPMRKSSPNWRRLSPRLRSLLSN